ncbi:unnamed protein product [Acanthoscelides obtectus]|nr:unnamed protein product [Acanthoscelides obtectus]CAH1972626.1 unnamed protein product [Acanthoscelides obtectus]CAK1639988.1 hypothetical protein AOBTE_LOCUS11485 [Acanthoscelides obtectus]CAK1639996.1 hypothetical protein AOBTE_LOCUS11491 [Acanthoscelides obtectus]
MSDNARNDNDNVPEDQETKEEEKAQDGTGSAQKSRTKRAVVDVPQRVNVGVDGQEEQEF